MHFLPVFNHELPSMLFYAFASAVVLQLLFTLLIQGRLAFFKDKKDPDNHALPPVSIILAARNESDNLYEHLPFILEQDYPEFELIVINHQSTDDSFYLLKAFKREYPNLKIIEVAKNPHLVPGKKLPITLGIKGASYEHLLFTDADCKPASNEWLKSMASRFTEKKEIVLGYGPYNKEKGFLNRVIRFDTAQIGVSYFSMALSGLPYMGVGRNLAYTKSVFNQVNGFKNHYSLPSGDDDLFIQQAAKKGNYTINTDPQSYCYSAPHTTWSGWLRQKRRHYTTSEKYSVIKKALLGIYPFSMLLMLILFVILLFNTDFRWIALAVFIFVTSVKWWIQAKCFKQLNEKTFIAYLPLWDLFYTILMPVLYYSTEKKKTNRW